MGAFRLPGWRREEREAEGHAGVIQSSLNALPPASELEAKSAPCVGSHQTEPIWMPEGKGFSFRFHLFQWRSQKQKQTQGGKQLPPACPQCSAASAHPAQGGGDPFPFPRPLPHSANQREAICGDGGTFGVGPGVRTALNHFKIFFL